MFGAYVRENRKVVIALAVYTAVFAFIFWLYRLPLGAVGYAALVCLFLLLVWLAVDYRRFAVRLRLLRRLEQEITLSTEQLPEPDGALEAQYQALVRALDADRRAQLTRSQQGYQELVEYYTVWAHQIKTPIAAMRLLLQDADTDEQRALLEQVQSVEQYVERWCSAICGSRARRQTMLSATTRSTISSGRRCASMPRSSSGAGCAWSTRR